MLHKTAIISKKAEIGNQVKIGPYCIIGDKVIINDGVDIKSHVVIEGRVTIGAGTVIYPFASLCYPQTLKYKGEDSEIIIGKNNTIREYVTIQHGTTEGGLITSIGDNCLLMVGVHIAHNCRIGNNVIFANYVSLAGHVEVGDYAMIGGLSGVHQFTRIGAHSMIGGCSALDKDLIPYSLASNKRARLEGLNLIGLNRRGFDKKQSLEASNVIKELFSESSSLLFAERLERTKSEYPHNRIIQEIIEFVQKDSSRSFCRI